MIIAKVSGGLGNQLFQYALGRALSTYHNVPLKLDLSAYNDYKLHPYRLNCFQVVEEVANNEDIISLKGKNDIVSRLLRKIGVIRRKSYYKEKQRTKFDSQVFAKKTLYVDGYWQNEEYFIGIREHLLKELQPTKLLSKPAYEYQEKIDRYNAVSIHVRRGDYLKHPEIGVLDVEYYKKATKYIIERVEAPHFFVFSNDIGWCKENFDFIDNVTYIEGTENEIDDLMLMSRCKHNIVANSSFSWWAAWLNKNDNKFVLAPKVWMKMNPEGNKWVPDSWVEIE